MEVTVNNVKNAIMIQPLKMKKRKNVNIKRRNVVKKILTILILILKMKSVIKNAGQKYAKFLKSRESLTDTNM
jgi:hypothetical protein